MKLIKEKNIIQTIFSGSVVIVLFLSIALICTFIIFEYQNLSRDLKKIEKNYIHIQKEKIKAAVDSRINQFEMLRTFIKKRPGSSLTDNEIARRVINLLSRDKKDKKKTGYIFILKLHDINGGKEFATMLMNPNLPELVGQKIPDSYKGAHGKQFVKEMLPKIKAGGDAFVEYWFRKPGSDRPSPKITYWKLFPQWQWIIGKGIYLDDLETIVSQKKTAAFLNMKKKLFIMGGICLIFIAGAIGLAYIFSRSINTLFSDYKIKQLQQKKNLQRFDLIINQAHDGIVVTDLDGSITYVNNSWAQMHGYRQDQLTGRHMKIFHSLEQMTKEVIPCIEKTRENGFHNCEIGHMHKDGSFFPTTMSSTLLLNEKNEPEGFLGIAIDISPLVRARRKAEEASLAKSTFLANMSHEIRTPMNGIIGMTRLALETSLSYEQKKLLTNIQICADGLLGLLNDILDFSKIEAGQLIMEKKNFDLFSLLDNIISILSFDARKKGLNLILDKTSESPIFIKGDELRLRQILVNLIGNSIKFTRKGTITLRVSPVDLLENRIELHFSVKDTGIGIPLTDQKKIFDYFIQADTSTARKFGGTGLGLAITRQLVKMMGGKIWLESTKGQGTIFYFTIVFERGNKKKASGTLDILESGLKNLRILLVEDNDINRDLATMVLSKEKCRVIAADNGLKALKILSEKQIDFILMDIQMPVMDGLTTTKIIRDYEKNNTETQNIPADLKKKLSRHLCGGRIPVIAMTANAMAGDKEKCLAAGMDDYLTKPFIPKDLISVINRLKL